jgi:hypothetical protein
VLGRHEHEVPETQAGNVDVGDVQRLRIDVSVDLICEQPPERSGYDVRRPQHCLRGVLAGAAVVVVVGEHADLRRGRR